MKTAIISTLVISTILRLLTCVIFYGPRNNILAQIGGPGLFTAIRAATVDPIHTWDHLEESCFWRENAPSPWISMGEKGGEDGLRVDNPSTTGHYGDIYTPGTRIVLPPLVFAFLGETLVCPGGVTTDVPKLLLWILQRLLLLVADGIGAWAIYQMGKRIIHMDELSDEEDMERQTQQSEMNDEKNYGKLVVPGMLRPEMGWIFGLSTKIINQEHIFETDGDNKTKIENGIKNNANNTVDGNGVNQKQQNNNHRTASKEVSVNKDSNQKAQKIPKELILTPQQLPLIAALFYFINPIAMIANAIGSLRGVWDALFLLSLYYAVTSPVKMTKEGIPTKIPSASKSAFCLALATYVDVAYGMFILPILLWRGILPARQAKKIQRDLHRDWKSFICLYAFHLICLHILASVLVGGDWTTYRKVMLRTILPNVAFLEQDESGSVPGPSMGLHW